MITDVSPFVPTHEQRSALHDIARILRDVPNVNGAHSAAERASFLAMLPIWQRGTVQAMEREIVECRTQIVKQSNLDYWISENLLSADHPDRNAFDAAAEMAQECSQKARQLDLIVETLVVDRESALSR